MSRLGSGLPESYAHVGDILAFAKFVQTPEFSERMTQLAELQATSESAFVKAEAAKAEAETALSALSEMEAELKKREDDVSAREAAIATREERHERRRARIAEAIKDED